jgi:hypothetical protein
LNHIEPLAKLSGGTDKKYNRTETSLKLFKTTTVRLRNRKSIDFSNKPIFFRSAHTIALTFLSFALSFAFLFTIPQDGTKNQENTAQNLNSWNARNQLITLRARAPRSGVPGQL